MPLLNSHYVSTDLYGGIVPVSEGTGWGWLFSGQLLLWGARWCVPVVSCTQYSPSSCSCVGVGATGRGLQGCHPQGCMQAVRCKLWAQEWLQTLLSCQWGCEGTLGSGSWLIMLCASLLGSKAQQPGQLHHGHLMPKTPSNCFVTALCSLSPQTAAGNPEESPEIFSKPILLQSAFQPRAPTESKCPKVTALQMQFLSSSSSERQLSIRSRL